MIKKFEDVRIGLSEILRFKNGFYYIIHKNLLATFGKNEDINMIYCISHNIDNLYMDRDDGCMVLSPHDVSFVAIRPSNESFNTRLVQFIVSKLRECGVNAVEDHNDIIVDGHFKVAGCTKTKNHTTGQICSFLHVSVSDNWELIRHLCLKPRKKMPDGLRKTPSGLSKWGINEFDLEKWWLEFLKINYEKEFIWAK